MKTETTLIKRDETKKSAVISVEKENGEKFLIPVVHVQDGLEERLLVKKMIKAQNKSKFMQPTYSLVGHSYQASKKNN